MAETLADLRTKAKGLGIAATKIRGASTVRELKAVIADFNEDEKPAKKKTVAKKAAPPKRGRGRPVGSKNKPKEEEAPKRRGRPPGSGVKKSASGTKAPAKSTKGTAKRPSPAPRRTTRKQPVKNGDAGRFMLESVDYTETEGWNPREGSPPDLIVRALKKFRGNREKVYDFLAPDVWDFVDSGKTARERRPKAEALKMLRYRIARTDWEFAVRTGQHVPSENRAEYGSQVEDKKPARKAPAAKKAPAKAPARRGRPPKAQEAPKRRGRPPGSKNKVKVAAKATTARKTATRRTAAKRTTRR
jgi:hypothetical protein